MRMLAAAALLLLASPLSFGCAPEEEPATEVMTGISSMPLAADPPAFFQLAASGFHSCGVASDGPGWCWGSGPLGDGSFGSLTPVQVAGDLEFRQVTVDGSNSCGVTTGFQAYCWNDGGPPTPVPGGLRFYNLNAGFTHTCGVSYPDRQGYCWGSNSFGELGDATLTHREVPTLVSGGLRFRHLSAGAHYSCGLTVDDKAYCWGDNQFGQLGDGSLVAQRKRPGPISGNLAFTQLEVGTAHTCAVTRDSRAYCWGYGKRGQVGDGALRIRRTPRAVAGGLTFRRVAPGSGFTCAERPDNTVYCWGSNEFGQIGDGTTTRRLTPVALRGGLKFAQVGAGGWNACGRTPDNVGYCWGLNSGGQLGDGTNIDRHRPAPIVGPAPAGARAGFVAQLRARGASADTLAQLD